MSRKDTSAIERLAELIKERNDIDAKIAAVIGRPSLSGHIGELVASRVFGITLQNSAAEAGYDGHFADGPLAGKTVNIKAYGKRENLLDINPDHVPDFYLVLAGPKVQQTTSRGGNRPWVISEVFLFDAGALIKRLRQRETKIGIATSVPTAEWENARSNTASRCLPPPLRGRVGVGGNSPQTTWEGPKIWQENVPVRSGEKRPMLSGSFGLSCGTANWQGPSFGGNSPSALTSSILSALRKSSSSRWMAGTMQPPPSEMPRAQLGSNRRVSRFCGSGIMTCSRTSREFPRPFTSRSERPRENSLPLTHLMSPPTLPLPRKGGRESLASRCG